METLNIITGRAVDTAYRIHSTLGPGMRESVYEAILARDLARCGYRVRRQEPVSFDFEGMWFQDAFKPDLVIEGAVVIEVKSVSHLNAGHHKQLLTYLRILDCRVGLLLNFGAPLMKDGIVRIVNRI